MEEHVCKYCGTATSQPDAECYKAPRRIKLWKKIKPEIVGIWQIVWRVVVALIILLARRTKIVCKEIKYIGDPSAFGNMKPISVRVEYKTRLRWYSPFIWVLIIFAAIQSLWDGGLKEFLEDNEGIFSWSEEKYMNWSYKSDYKATNLRVKFDIWLLTIIENI